MPSRPPAMHFPGQRERQIRPISRIMKFALMRSVEYLVQRSLGFSIITITWSSDIFRPPKEQPFRKLCLAAQARITLSVCFRLGFLCPDTVYTLFLEVFEPHPDQDREFSCPATI